MSRGILSIMLTVAVGASGRAELPSRQIAAVDAAVKAEMERQHLVGVAVGVVREGRLAYVQGYGLADREHNVVVTPKTVFNWASNSKPIAAVLAMQLVDQRKLDLDADVRTYVPEFPDKGDVITARQLMCHQSGLPHYTNGKLIGTPRTHPGELPLMDPVLALDRFNQSPLLFKPGTKASYTTFGTILLCAVIQRAGGKPFAEQLRERIITPLKLESMQYDVPAKGQPHWATGYRKRTEQIERLPDEAHYWKHGGGGFKSNVEDFSRWAEALLNRRVVSEASEKIMWTPQRTRDDKATTFGLGFQVANARGQLRVSHGGAQGETKTMMMLEPRAKNGIVVMSNSGYADPGAIARAIQAALNQ